MQLVTSQGNYAVEANGILHIGSFADVMETSSGVRLSSESDIYH